MCDKNNVLFERLRQLIDTDTREKIAKAIGCDTSYVTKHYNGDRRVNFEFLCKYANYFNVTTDFLLGLSNTPTKSENLAFTGDYTGLSLKSISQLNKCVKIGAEPFIDFINMLIDKISTNETVLFNFTDVRQDKFFLSEMMSKIIEDYTDEDIKILESQMERLSDARYSINGLSYEIIKTITKVFEDYTVSSSGLTVEEFEEIQQKFIERCKQCENEPTATVPCISTTQKTNG